MDSPILEVKKTIEVEKSIKLVDINGKKICFQSDCIVESIGPGQIAIVNQNELDNGSIPFEEFHGGIYKRRVTYENTEHLNHYIAFKKLPSHDKPVTCNIVVQLKELEQKPEPIMSVLNYPEPVDETLPPLIPLSETIDPRDKEELYMKLKEMSHSSNSFYNKVGIACIIILVLFMLLRR